MLTLQNRINLLTRLQQYLLSEEPKWKNAITRAGEQNGWFIPAFVDQATRHIARQYLDANLVHEWVGHYHIDDNISPRKVGIVMAGNLPLVGFHDMLSVFVTGHQQVIKPSSKDEILIKHLVAQLHEWEPATRDLIRIEPILKGCDAYIATGSNNSAARFDYYFGRYPSIIRRNRTSVAVLDGTETTKDLENLSADIHLYFGLGCRNVTKIYVPEHYDFIPLLASFHSFRYFADHHKYRNNYDYNLSLHILNNRYYMTDGTTLLVENESFFSPVSQLNYSFYADKAATLQGLENHPDIQCIAGVTVPLGRTQQPALRDYADGVDTLQFLLTL